MQLERRHHFQITAGGLTPGKANEFRALLTRMVEVCPSLHSSESIGLTELDSEVSEFDRRARLREVESDD